jgi:hypothetical protein
MSVVIRPTNLKEFVSFGDYISSVHNIVKIILHNVLTNFLSLFLCYNYTNNGTLTTHITDTDYLTKQHIKQQLAFCSILT